MNINKKQVAEIKSMLLKYHLQKSDQLFAIRFGVSVDKIRRIRQRMGLKKDRDILIEAELKTDIRMEKHNFKRGPDQGERRESIQGRIKREGREEMLKKKMFG